MANSKHTKKDITSPNEPFQQLAMAAIGAAGTPLARWLAEKVWPNPSNTLRDQFLLNLANRVEAMETTDLFAKLSRPEVIPLLQHALQIADRSLGQAKLRALENVIAEGVIHNPGNFNRSSLALHILGDLTDQHLTMLQSIYDREVRRTPIPWDDVNMLGVETHDTDEGMVMPRQALDQRFYDQALEDTNRIIRDDLSTRGLIAEMTGPVPPIYEWSTDPKKNLPGFAMVTAKGRLFISEIASRAAVEDTRT